MGKFEIALPDDLDAAVEAAVARGDFQSKEEAVCAAVEEWRSQELLNALSVEDLRRLWDEGVASGFGEQLSIDEIKEKARARPRVAAR